MGDQSGDGEPQLPSADDQTYSQSPDRVLQGREGTTGQASRLHVLNGAWAGPSCGKPDPGHTISLSALATNPRRAACTKLLSLI